MALKAVIFDLDGVIVSTDECHYQAWLKMASEEGIYFDRDINQRLRGVSRMESLNIVLERAKKYSEQEKLELATRKNEYYKEMIKKLTPANLLAGVSEFLSELRERGIKLAIGSSSKNSPAIIERIGLSGYFDAEADGNDISKSKPDPEVFLLAAKRLNIDPSDCLVVEDAAAGVEAAIAAGMRVLAVGSAANHPAAHISATDLSSVTVDAII